MADLSHNQKRDLLRAALKGVTPDKGYAYIEDIFDTYFVYKHEDYSTDTYKLYKADYSIDSNSAVTLGDPVEVVEQKSYVPVVATLSETFSGEAMFSASGDEVEREGIIFRLGDYPDKALSVNAAEAAAAVAAFPTDGVNLELEHFDTEGKFSILTGKLGRLNRVWLDGDYIKGSVKVPSWIDSVWGDAGRKVSVVWDRGTKMLTRTGLVLKPRVQEAAVMSNGPVENSLWAAFTEHERGTVDPNPAPTPNPTPAPEPTPAPSPAPAPTTQETQPMKVEQQPADAERANARANAAFSAAQTVMAESFVDGFIYGQVLKSEVRQDLVTLSALLAGEDIEARAANNGVAQQVSFGEAGAQKGGYLDLLRSIIQRIAAPHGLGQNNLPVNFAQSNGAPPPAGDFDDPAELEAVRKASREYAASMNGTGA